MSAEIFHEKFVRNYRKICAAAKSFSHLPNSKLHSIFRRCIETKNFPRRERKMLLSSIAIKYCILVCHRLLLRFNIYPRIKTQRKNSVDDDFYIFIFATFSQKHLKMFSNTAWVNKMKFISMIVVMLKTSFLHEISTFFDASERERIFIAITFAATITESANWKLFGVEMNVWKLKKLIYEINIVSQRREKTCSRGGCEPSPLCRKKLW